MKKYLITFLFLAYNIAAFSQFSDDFSDGNFINNPTWEGNANAFEIDTGLKLHLNDSIANTSYLSTASNAIINGSWEFEIKLDFDPSTSNYAKIYLTSDVQDLTGNLNGYFVKVGGESGAVDEIALYTQVGVSAAKIIDGTDGLAASSPDIKIKVLRDDLGNWELYVDTSGNYFLEGVGFDNSTSLSNYFGVVCKYTSTRGDKFWFDNFIVSGVEDTTAITTSHNDVIINEIFVDPSPSIGLPEHEYIELYNTTNSSINLSGWTITIGTTEKTFPNSVIEADSFLILIKEDVVDSFPNNISKIGLTSVSLTNSGSNIILKNNVGLVINSIAYTDRWYNDDNKSDGGWSIERVNPSLFCEGKNNWRAAKANLGGTPGKQNSVFGETVAISELRITKAFITESNKVQIEFNKNLTRLILQDSSLFIINNSNPYLNTPLEPFFNRVTLAFDFNFLPNTTYSVSTLGLLDCSGNLVSNSISFGLPDSALANQILINEVLFNPNSNGVDYIELLNNSNSYFDLSKLRVANFFEFGFENYAENPKIITEGVTLFSPKSYLVITSDSAKVKDQYFCENPYNFIEINSMPSLPNEGGTICIVHQSLNQIIDAFEYDENLHFSLLETTKGVSLERLSANSKTQSADNWHSASSTVGFGTPSYKNSQDLISQSLGEVTVFPKSFSPNNDGDKDVCAIMWDFSESNLMATIKVFDDEGRFVKKLLSNKMIGNSGDVIWDGTSEGGLQLNTGMYIIWVEVFSINGNVERFKEIIVLSK
tara:strand:- start:10328 stop:12625 length:2298 start_codon:yes stop_codon:yes gene_type:complete